MDRATQMALEYQREGARLFNLGQDATLPLILQIHYQEAAGAQYFCARYVLNIQGGR